MLTEKLYHLIIQNYFLRNLLGPVQVLILGIAETVKMHYGQILTANRLPKMIEKLLPRK